VESCLVLHNNQQTSSWSITEWSSAVRFLTRTFRNVVYVRVGKRYVRMWRLQRSRTVTFFVMHFTSFLGKQFAGNDTFLREANSYKPALALRNSWQVLLHRQLGHWVTVFPGSQTVTQFHVWRNSPSMLCRHWSVSDPVSCLEE